MSVEVKITGSDQTKAKLMLLANKISAAPLLMDEIGLFLRHSIRDRTSKGLNAEGESFKEYSNSWKKVRESVGLQTDKVDLFFGGSMLSSMTHESNKDTTKVFFLDTPHVDLVAIPGKKKRGDHGTNRKVASENEQLRPFFSISVKERKEIAKMYSNYIKSILRKK